MNEEQDEGSSSLLNMHLHHQNYFSGEKNLDIKNISYERGTWGKQHWESWSSQKEDQQKEGGLQMHLCFESLCLIRFAALMTMMQRSLRREVGLNNWTCLWCARTFDRTNTFPIFSCIPDTLFLWLIAIMITSQNSNDRNSRELEANITRCMSVRWFAFIFGVVQWLKDNDSHCSFPAKISSCMSILTTSSPLFSKYKLSVCESKQSISNLQSEKWQENN